MARLPRISSEPISCRRPFMVGPRSFIRKGRPANGPFEIGAVRAGIGNRVLEHLDDAGQRRIDLRDRRRSPGAPIRLCRQFALADARGQRHAVMSRPFVPAHRQSHAIPFLLGSGANLSFAPPQVNQCRGARSRASMRKRSRDRCCRLSAYYNREPTGPPRWPPRRWRRCRSPASSSSCSAISSRA